MFNCINLCYILCETTAAALVTAAALCCLCNKEETNTTISKFLSPGAPLIPYYNSALAILIISDLKITSGYSNSQGKQLPVNLISVRKSAQINYFMNLYQIFNFQINLYPPFLIHTDTKNLWLKSENMA